MTGCGRVGQNRLLDQVELHTTGCVQFDPVFRTLRKYMNRLRFRFDPKREKNRTEPDLQTLSVAMSIENCDVCLEIFSSMIWVAIAVVQPIGNVRIYDCGGSRHWL